MNRLPSYVIHAGLVFTQLTQPYLLEYGEDWFNTSPRKLCIKAITDTMAEPDQEVCTPSVHTPTDTYTHVNTCKHARTHARTDIHTHVHTQRETNNTFCLQLVILSHVLVHEINDGYQGMTNLQLLKCNGQKILNLKQLMHIMRTNTEPYLRFDFDDDL